MAITFRATVRLGGKTATGIPVPAEVVDSLGQGRRVAVQVTIGAYRYRSTIASMGGEFMLPLSAEHRAGAGVAAGDDIEVSVAVDTAPRAVEVPPDLVAALEAAPDAKATFEALSYSRQLRQVASIEAAKTDATRERRVAKTISDLREGRA